MHPYNLIGMRYRLGADPERHGAADCLTLAKAVLQYQGVVTPPAQRSWYRRLRRGDTDVFREELERWGSVVDAPKLVTVALCHSDLGYGMATYFEGGFIHFGEEGVRWSPLETLEILDLFEPKYLSELHKPDDRLSQPQLLS